MKIEFDEWQMGAQFTMTPETPEEVAMIARLAANASSEKVEVNFYFSDKPKGTVWIKKVKESVQHNSIEKRLT